MSGPGDFDVFKAFNFFSICSSVIVTVDRVFRVFGLSASSTKLESFTKTLAKKLFNTFAFSLLFVVRVLSGFIKLGILGLHYVGSLHKSKRILGLSLYQK